MSPSEPTERTSTRRLSGRTGGVGVVAAAAMAATAAAAAMAVALAAAAGCSGARDRAEKKAAGLLAKGQALLKQGKILEAERALRKAVKRAPGNLDAWRALSRALVAGGKVREAAQVLGEALRKTGPNHPHRYEALTELGAALGRQGKHDQAVGVYDRARKLRPSRPEAYFKLAEMYTAYRQYDVARALYGKFAEMHRGRPLAAETLLRWAAMEQKAGRPEPAVQLLERALKAAAGSQDAAVRIRLRLGEALMDLNRQADALAHFENAVALKPRNGRAQANLGECLAALGRCAKALAPLRKAVALEPSRSRPAAVLAACLERSGNKAHRDEAYAMALKAKTLDPDNAELLFLVARLHLERGLAKPALDLLDRIRDGAKGKPDPDHLRLRGRAYAALGEYVSAIRAFSGALALNPGDHTAFRLRALAARKAGAYRRAEQDLGAVVERDPRDYEALTNLGIAREHLKKRYRARDALLKAARLDPRRQEAWVYLGWIHLRAGDTKKAEGLVRKALALQGGHRIHALDVLAQIRARQGKIAEAAAALRQARGLARTPAERNYIDRFLARLEPRKKARPSH